MKVLLGESPGCEGENVVPSKSGLLTVLEVLKIQMKFWPTLEPVLAKLQSQWGACAFPNRSECNPFLLIFPAMHTILLVKSVWSNLVVPV